MNEKDRVERDIGLTFDFLRYLIAHPEMIDKIPDGAKIEFVGSDIITTELAEGHREDGKQTIIVTKRVFEVAPQPLSQS
jgi:hypothetical protein